MRYLIVLNEDAGRAGKTPPGGAPEELREAFSRAGVAAEVRIAEAARLAETVRAALKSRPDAVIIGGGDGTVRSAAAELAGTGVPLGVLPMGTFNHFAKDLGVPVDLPAAVTALAGAASCAVDLGEVNGHVFINNCSIGAYAQAVRRRDALRKQRGLGKWWAMVRASFEQFRRLRRMRLRISTADGGPAPSVRQAQDPARGDGLRAVPTRLVRTPVVVVGNNRYSGWLLSQHLRPRLDAGQLWLYTVRAHRHLAVLRMMLQSFVRRLDEVDSLAAEPAQEIAIASEGVPPPVVADGEILGLSPPLHFRIRPGALRVLRPEIGRTTQDRRQTTEDRAPGPGGRAPAAVLALQPRASRSCSRTA